MANATNIIQKEWFKVSSGKKASAEVLEDHLDAYEALSRALLSRVVNLADANGNTAMHYAVSMGNFDLVSVLLNSRVCNLNQQNKAGYTAVMLLALAKISSDVHEGVVNKLFETSDVNIKASQVSVMYYVGENDVDVMLYLTFCK